MAVSKEQLEDLKQKVVAAFDNVAYPKEEIAPHDCDECEGVRKTFTNLNWKTIESKIIEENYDKLPLFSPQAFHYFLPAYLIYSLERFEEDFNEVPEFTVYSLTPDKDIKENPDWWRERFKEFTKEQFDLIYEFLDLAEGSEEFRFFVTNIQRGKERLKRLIEPTLKN